MRAIAPATLAVGPDLAGQRALAREALAPRKGDGRGRELLDDGDGARLRAQDAAGDLRGGYGQRVHVGGPAQPQQQAPPGAAERQAQLGGDRWWGEGARQ